MFDIHVDTSAPRGRTLDGGTIWSLGIKVPRGVSSGEGRAAHGPLHPAVYRSLETLKVFMFIFVLRSWFRHLVDCIAFFCLWVWSSVWSLSPSSPDPCLVFCMGPSFFLCLVVFVDAVFSLSLSQALGKSKPFWFGFSPCVLFFLHTLSDLDPYFEFRHVHLGEAPAPCLFSSPSLVGMVAPGLVPRGFCKVFGLCPWVLSFGFCWSGRSLLVLHAAVNA